MQAEADAGGGEASDACRFALFRRAFVQRQRAQFFPSEIDEVPVAVCTGTVGEDVTHVTGVVEDEVVRHDGYAILGDDHILFEVIRTLGVGQRLGFQRVLGQVAGGATMRDDQQMLRRRDGRAGRLGGEHGSAGA